MKIYSVSCEVLVEADSAEQAQALAKAFLDELDESEIWSSEVGVAIPDELETAEYLRLHRDMPGDITSYGDRP